MTDIEKAKHAANFMAHSISWFEKNGVFPDDAVEIMLVATVLMRDAIKETEGPAIEVR